MDVLKTIYSRVSTRDFIPSTISDSDIQTILNCGMSAPVGLRRYDTLHFTVITDKELILSIAKASNMASIDRPSAPFYGSETLILVSSKFERSDNIEYANVGCVMQSMAIGATALGIANIYLWGVIRTIKSHPDFLAKLNLPVGFVPVSILALGTSATPLEQQDAPRHNVGINYIK